LDDCLFYSLWHNIHIRNLFYFINLYRIINLNPTAMQHKSTDLPAKYAYIFVAIVVILGLIADSF
jgi:hypothetical protein